MVYSTRKFGPEPTVSCPILSCSNLHLCPNHDIKHFKNAFSMKLLLTNPYSFCCFIRFMPPQSPYVSTANGTQVHPNSTHFGSLATSLRNSATTAAISAVKQDSSRMAGVSGDVTVISKAAGDPLSHLATRTSAERVWLYDQM